MNPATTHGAFSWSELWAPDPASAAEFYSNLLGYNTETMEMDQGPYTVLKVGDTPAAGVMGLPDDNAPPNWSFYVTVDDVDAAAVRAKELGATEVWPLVDVPEVGRMGGLADPQGAYFAIITYSYPPMEGPEPDFADAFKTHGAFSWFELRTSDVEAAKAFYSGLFGWNIEEMPIGDDIYTVINVGEVGVGGVIPLPMPGVPPHWGGYITVDDSDAIAEAAAAAGATVKMSMDIPTVGRVNTIEDAQGAVVSLVTYESAPDSEQGEEEAGTGG